MKYVVEVAIKTSDVTSKKQIKELVHEQLLALNSQLRDYSVRVRKVDLD